MVITLAFTAVGCSFLSAPQSAAQDQASSTPATPTPFGETLKSIGNSDVLFDIYQKTALVDLDMDGTPKKVEFLADEATSELRITGEELTIVRVYGPYWYKLQYDNGKTGWLKCKYQVMHYTESDTFSGL